MHVGGCRGTNHQSESDAPQQSRKSSAYRPVISQVACALAILGLLLTRPAQALFKTINRFVLQRDLFRVYKYG
ncbi:hypothetical protein DN614_00245 [Klebsiella michiganensis]|uniref:Uncharacterized protein n=1 Tax=Klebsiella michiganensis TaxID=1134687 RepID=A0A2J4QSR5_9ENTR|nr:hypothetical protein CWN50_19855 [Klebsiella michiganensis]RWS91723.1 hypothetical protein DN614_00245 [Klebsiella michiganensis]